MESHHTVHDFVIFYAHATIIKFNVSLKIVYNVYRNQLFIFMTSWKNEQNII